ncbi:hypothetical protein SAMN02745177_02165 [Desulforamulus hydrothermalis Lam5 = DSM 18033]|nr:hypothetical protein SAMN02745177_02165 [Desulforamulus hydrothermalis Lam5 = DSM 18033]
MHLIAMSHNEPKAIMICEGTKINQSMQLTDLATVRGKTIKAEMPRGTLESGVTNSLGLASAQTEYCNKSKVRLPRARNAGKLQEETVTQLGETKEA